MDFGGRILAPECGLSNQTNDILNASSDHLYASTIKDTTGFLQEGIFH